MKRADCVVDYGRSGRAVRTGVWTIGLVVVSIMLAAPRAWGQSAVWLPPGATTGNIYYNGGNVGIGTANPMTKLHIYGDTLPQELRLSGPLSQPGSVTELGRLSFGRNGHTYVNARIVGASDDWGPTYSAGELQFWTGTATSEAIQRLTITKLGNVGIGMTNPIGRLHIAQSAGVAAVSQAYAVANFENNYAGGGNALITLTGSYDGIVAAMTAAQGAVPMRFFTGTSERMRIGSDGNVGIGTTNPQYKLAVNGSIGAQDIIVTNTGWSDYVFRPGYRLRPLSEVNAFIQKHRHLPDIPTEAEVKEKGVSLGEMQAKLLAKVEELTLHVIELDEGKRQLERKYQELNTQFQALAHSGATYERNSSSVLQNQDAQERGARREVTTSHD